MIERNILMAEILAAVGMVKTFTPWSIKMMPENHPIEKENHLNQTSMTLRSVLMF